MRLWPWLILLSSCGVVQQVQQAKRFAKCEFRMTTIQQLELGGVNIQRVRSLKDLSLTKAARLTAALTEKTLPLTFDLNVESSNPNAETAALNKLEWRLFIDEKEMMAGEMPNRIEIPAHASAEFPIAISVDLKKVLSGEKKDAVLTLAFNLVGEGDRPSNILLQIKPTIVVAGVAMDYPGYFDVKARVDADTVKKKKI